MAADSWWQRGGLGDRPLDGGELAPSLSPPSAPLDGVQASAAGPRPFRPRRRPQFVSACPVPPAARPLRLGRSRHTPVLGRPGPSFISRNPYPRLGRGAHVARAGPRPTRLTLSPWRLAVCGAAAWALSPLRGGGGSPQRVCAAAGPCVASRPADGGRGRQRDGRRRHPAATAVAVVTTVAVATALPPPSLRTAACRQRPSACPRRATLLLGRPACRGSAVAGTPARDAPARPPPLSLQPRGLSRSPRTS